MQTKPQVSLQTPMAFNIAGANTPFLWRQTYTSSEMQEIGEQILKRNILNGQVTLVAWILAIK